MLVFASEGVDFDVADAFDDLIELVRKIELWWFKNFEMAIDPEAYPPDLDIESVIPGPVWSLRMLIDIALGPEEEAKRYYEHFVKSADELNKAIKKRPQKTWAGLAKARLLLRR